MQNLDDISERIHTNMQARTTARDGALAQARTLTRHCANAIRAIHRSEWPLADEGLSEARKLADNLCQGLKNYPDLYFAGYTQDALKEYAEASTTYAIVRNDPLPGPEELGIEAATYLQGLAEASGELRRRSLDALLKGQSQEAIRLLEAMDDIYDVLVTMDYPDAITGGLRRLTDIARGVTERTRGDLTLSLRQEHLEEALHRAEKVLNGK